MKKKNLKLIWQLVYIFGTIALLYLLSYADPNFKRIGANIVNIQNRWFYLCFACVLGFWLVQTCVLKYIGHFMGEKLSFLRNLKITVIGEYYSAITPSSTGGQPMQLGCYKRYGVNLVKSSCILAIRFIGYTSSLCLLYIIAMALHGAELYARNTTMFYLSIVGFLINAVLMVSLILLLFNKALIERICRWLIKNITRLKPFRKREERWNDKLDNGITDFSIAGEVLRHNLRKFIIVVLLSFASFLFLYSIPYFVYRAMGLAVYSYTTLFSMQVFLVLTVSYVPTPGAIGASESAFFLFFASLFPPESMYLAMMIWRLFSYYVGLIIGAIVVIWDEVYNMITQKNKKDR